MKKALLIVDIQYDFLPGGSLAVAEGDEIIPFVMDLINQEALYELIVATQDWHPPDHGSFASAHPGGKPFEMGELSGLEQVLWPDHCVQGEEGARVHRDLLHQLIKITETGQRTLIIKRVNRSKSTVIRPFSTTPAGTIPGFTGRCSPTKSKR